MSLLRLISESIRKSIERRHPRPIVCHKLKLLYYPVAKVASSSIRRYIFEHEYSHPEMAAEEREGAFVSFQFPRIPQKEVPKYVRDGYTTFTVVRNPYERVCSCYRDKILGSVKRGHLHKGFQRYNKLASIPIFTEEMPFISFLRKIAWIPDFASDAHFRSQVTFIPHAGNQILVDHVLKMEEFDIGFSDLVKKLGLPEWKPSRVNRTHPQESLLKSHPDTVPLIRRRYRRCFRILPYGLDDIPGE